MTVSASAHRWRLDGARLLLTLLATVLFASWPMAAHAHTELVASTPSAGDSVALSTQRLVLVFGADLVPGAGQVVVRDPAGADVTAGGPTISGGTVEVPLELATPGRHDVSYRVTGSDGHPIVASFTFDATRDGAGRTDPASLTPVPAADADGAGSASSGWAPGSAALWALTATGLVALVALVHRRSEVRRRSQA